jgi:hypothetical protein
VLLNPTRRMWSTCEISINEPETWKYLLRANGRKPGALHTSCFESTQQQNRISVYCIRQKKSGSMQEVLVL